MYNEIIYLVKEIETKDELGQVVTSKQERMAFALKKSITQTEFFKASKSNPPPYNGIRPAFCFEIQLLEYDDEEIIRYCDKAYKVYRTYPKLDTIELYCETRGGSNE